jgi:hypothetical protein
MQAWCDGALAPRRREAIARHLVGCAHCRQRTDAWQRASRAAMATAPAAELFSTDGAFWARLAPHLSPRRSAQGALVSLVPPFIFVSVGTVLNVAIGLAVIVRGLVRLGAIEPVGPWIGARMQSALGESDTSSLLRLWLGSGLHQVLRTALQAWNGFGATTQDALLFVIAVTCLGLGLTGAVTLCGWWAACSARRNRSERSEGVWNTAS